jgi:hypothetical protein
MLMYVGKCHELVDSILPTLNEPTMIRKAACTNARTLNIATRTKFTLI